MPVACQKPVAAGFRSLPPEILGEIFDILAETYPKRLLAPLCRVNSKFNAGLAKYLYGSVDLTRNVAFAHSARCEVFNRPLLSALIGKRTALVRSLSASGKYGGAIHYIPSQIESSNYWQSSGAYWQDGSRIDAHDRCRVIEFRRFLASISTWSHPGVPHALGILFELNLSIMISCAQPLKVLLRHKKPRFERSVHGVSKMWSKGGMFRGGEAPVGGRRQVPLEQSKDATDVGGTRGDCNVESDDRFERNSYSPCDRYKEPRRHENPVGG